MKGSSEYTIEQYTHNGAVVKTLSHLAIGAGSIPTTRKNKSDTKQAKYSAIVVMHIPKGNRVSWLLPQDWVRLPATIITTRVENGVRQSSVWLAVDATRATGYTKRSYHAPLGFFAETRPWERLTLKNRNKTDLQENHIYASYRRVTVVWTDEIILVTRDLHFLKQNEATGVIPIKVQAGITTHGEFCRLVWSTRVRCEVHTEYTMEYFCPLEE